MILLILLLADDSNYGFNDAWGTVLHHQGANNLRLSLIVLCIRIPVPHLRGQCGTFQA